VRKGYDTTSSSDDELEERRKFKINEMYKKWDIGERNLWELEL